MKDAQRRAIFARMFKSSPPRLRGAAGKGFSKFESGFRSFQPHVSGSGRVMVTLSDKRAKGLSQKGSRVRRVVASVIKKARKSTEMRDKNIFGFRDTRAKSGKGLTGSFKRGTEFANPRIKQNKGVRNRRFVQADVTIPFR